MEIREPISASFIHELSTRKGDFPLPKPKDQPAKSLGGSAYGLRR